MMCAARTAGGYLQKQLKKKQTKKCPWRRKAVACSQNLKCNCFHASATSRKC